MSSRSPVALALLFLTACQSPGSPGPDPQGWERHVQAFQEEYFRFNPSVAVAQGRHEFDGKLPDWSPEGLAGQAAWLNSVREATAKFPPEGLNASQRFEREYLLATVDGELFWRGEAEFPLRNPAFYVGTLDPDVYLTRPYAPLPQRMKSFIAYLRAVPAAAAQIRGNLRVPMPATYVEYGTRAFKGYAEFYRNEAHKAYDKVTDAALQAEFKQAIGPAAKAMEELGAWIEAARPTATQDFALGPQRFASMLWRTERVSTKLDELEAIGQADLKRNQAALKAACKQYAPKLTIDGCIAKAAKDKPRGGPVEGARAQLAELRAFIESEQLVTIPGTELALVEEAPAYQRANFAYINVPGPYDKGMPSVYYIAPPDPTWSKAVQEAYLPSRADLLFTSVHEIWPGHFLQFLHANRSPSLFGQLFVGYAFAEGWAHYSEEMMWEAGLGQGAPDIHIGQLSNALLRNVRYLCAIGMHTQGMSVKDCDRMFREQAYQDQGSALQQAARGTYDPAYLNYTMGKLMIRKMREEWTASRGGRQGWREFHDKLLSYGGPPLPLVREQMLGDKSGALF